MPRDAARHAPKGRVSQPATQCRRCAGLQGVDQGDLLRRFALQTQQSPGRLIDCQGINPLRLQPLGLPDDVGREKGFQLRLN